MKTALELAIVNSYGDENNYQSAYYGSGETTPRGLSIFFSRGDQTSFGNSHYSYHHWYTSESLTSSEGTYGNIDFCISNEDGIVDGWRELLEAWYDPDNTYTPSTF